MPRIKAELMTTPIKFYLRQFVSKAGPEPVALPSERALCARFNVARGTIRDAMQQLEEIDVLIRLPDKKGLFSNPRFYDPATILVGFISHTNGGFPSEFTSETSLLMSGIFQEFPRHVFYCNIIFPDRFSEDELVRFFVNQNLDAMIWFTPDLFYANLISRLRAEKVSLFTLSSIYRLKTCLPETPFDFYPEFTAIDVVMQEIETRFSPAKALFCFTMNKYQEQEWGIEIVNRFESEHLRKELFLPDDACSDLLAHKLKDDPEITVVYGTGRWYMQKPYIVEAVLKSGRKDIGILLEENAFSHRLKEEYPDLNIVVIKENAVRDGYRKTGVNAAKEIFQYIENKRQETEK